MVKIKLEIKRTLYLIPGPSGSGLGFPKNSWWGVLTTFGNVLPIVSLHPRFKLFHPCCPLGCRRCCGCGGCPQLMMLLPPCSMSSTSQAQRTKAKQKKNTISQLAFDICFCHLPFAIRILSCRFDIVTRMTQ